MPSSIFVELITIDGLFKSSVDMIEVEVPGQYVRTLTCASQLIQKLSFSKVAFEKRKI